MVFRIEPDEPVADAIPRVVRERIDHAVARIDDQAVDEHEAVHEVRKAGKEIRAAFRLIRSSAPELYERENAHYRDLARPLSELRDANVHLDSYDTLVDTFAAWIDRSELEVIRETLEERRDELADELSIDARLTAARSALLEGRARLDRVEVEDREFAAIAGGLGRTYARARARFVDAYEVGSAHAFHQFRKRAKYHRYHVDLLLGAWPSALEAREEERHDLADILGEEHDLAELRATLLTEPERFPDGQPVETFIGLIERQRTRLQREAEPLADLLLSDDPDAFVARVEALWVAWRAGSEALSA